MTKRQIKNLCCEMGFILEFELDDEMYFYKRYNTHEGKIEIIKDTFHNAYQLYNYYIVGKNYHSFEKIDNLKNALSELLKDVSNINEFIE